jgi:hypothetical protein
VGVRARQGRGGVGPPALHCRFSDCLNASHAARCVSCHGVRSQPMLHSTTRRTRAEPEGESDEAIQFTQVERLAQITDSPLDQHLGLPLGVPTATHYEDWRLHAEVTDALQQVDALFPGGPAGACRWHDQVQQNEVELLTSQDIERIGNRMRRSNLVSVPVLEASKELTQYPHHVRLIVDDEDSLRHARFTSWAACHIDFSQPLGHITSSSIRPSSMDKSRSDCTDSRPISKSGKSLKGVKLARVVLASNARRESSAGLGQGAQNVEDDRFLGAHGVIPRPRWSITVRVPADRSAARTGHPDLIVLDGGVEIAAKPMLLEEGVEVGEE